MQTANILLALGGDTGNTVPKFGVTPAEVAVLQLIHGDESVFDILPAADVKRTNREELSRLRLVYGKPAGSNERSAVDVLFPGAAARVFDSFNELEIDESFYKAEKRVKPKPDAETGEEEAAPVKLTAAERRAAKAAAKAEAEVASTGKQIPDERDDGSAEGGDGIDDINDGVAKSDDGIFG